MIELTPQEARQMFLEQELDEQNKKNIDYKIKLERLKALQQKNTNSQKTAPTAKKNWLADALLVTLCVGSLLLELITALYVLRF